MSKELLLGSPELSAVVRDEERRGREACQVAIEAFKIACKATEVDVLPPTPILKLLSLMDNLVSVIHVLKKRTQTTTYPEGLSNFIDKFPYFNSSFPKPAKLEIAFFYVICQHVLRLSRGEGLEEIDEMKAYALKLMKAFPARKSQHMRERNKTDALIRTLKQGLIFHYVGYETQHYFSGFQAQEVRQGFARVVKLRNHKVNDLFGSLAYLEKKIQGIASFLGGEPLLPGSESAICKSFSENKYVSDDLLYDLSVLPILRDVVKISRDNQLCAAILRGMTTLIKSGWTLLKAEGCLPFFKMVVDALVCAPWKVPSVLNALVPFLQQERDLSRLKSALIGVAHLSHDWVLMDADLPKLLDGLFDHALPDECCVQEPMSCHEIIEEILALPDRHKLPKGMTQAMHDCGEAILKQGESVRQAKNPLLAYSMLAIQRAGVEASHEKGSADLL